MTLAYRIVDVTGPLGGPLGLVGSPAGVRRLYLPDRSAARARAAIRRDEPEAIENARLMPAVARLLQQYFAGRRVDLAACPLDLQPGSAFEEAIWRACLEIPYGLTMTYGELAAAAGHPGAARAVGTAMRRNRIPLIIPCHRVTAAGGQLGGYSAPGGTDVKRRLLDQEARVAALDREPKIYGFDKPYAWIDLSK
jgi:methylated-DNA-[protein]-cysteine S-methyltransferase